MHCGKLLEEVGGWNSETMKLNAGSQNISEFMYVLTFLFKRADNNITCCAVLFIELTLVHINARLHIT